MAGFDSAEFWEEAAGGLYDKTARSLFEIFYRGGAVGAKMLPARMRVLLDWDLFNAAAQAYLDIYKLDTVGGVTAVIREKAVKTIQGWIESGQPLPDLMQQLEPLFGAGRAERIAVTEVTRTYAAGNLSAWKATGMVTAKVWQTANDERVCPICGPLHGQVVSIDGGFSLDLNELPQELARSGEEFTYIQPPAHPNCRCWMKPVVSEESIRGSIRGALNG